MLDSANDREFWIDLSSFSVWASTHEEAYAIAVKKLAEAPLDYIKVFDHGEID